MGFIFEVRDKSGRRIHLAKERWGEHIRLEHPDIIDAEEIKQTILYPDKIIEERESIYNYYKFFKHKKSKLKFLKVIVKFFKFCGNLQKNKPKILNT